MREALRLGAMPVHLSWIQLGPWASPDEKAYGVGPDFASYIAFPYGILINPKTGSRFVNEKRQALAFECQEALFKYNELVTQNMPQPLYPLSDCIAYWLRFDIPKERLEEFTNCDVDTRHIKRGFFDDCLREDRSVVGGIAEHSKMMRICWPTLRKEEKTCQNLEKLRSYDITKEDLAALKQNCI